MSSESARLAARAESVPEMAEAIESERTRLTALFHIGQAICSSLDENEILDRILQTTREVLGARICSLRLLEKDSGELRVARQMGINSFDQTVFLGQSVVGRAVKERRPIVVSDIATSNYKQTSLARKLGLKSMISVPLLIKDMALGGLTIYSQTVRGYDNSEITLLMSIASQAAVAITNAQLHHDTVNTLVSMARAIEAKDAYTQGHSQRVSDYAARIAREAGFGREEVRVLERMCPVHDIGKVGISETIINKPGRLNDRERLIIERHPVIGANILGPVHVFSESMEIVRSHHERLDGRGYPDGLSAGDISPLVRITTVADCYDAMTSRRSYRAPMRHEDAVAELRRNKGRQFDADFVEIFVDVLSEGAGHA